MNVLEKILKEIDVLEDKEYDSEKYTECFIDGANCAISDVRAIIRSHMNDGKDTDVPTNDGWIPCSERLPEGDNGRYYPMLNVSTSYGAVKWGFYRVKDKEWYIYSELHDEFVEAKDKEILAWRRLPEPYKPADPKPVKNTQQEMEDFWRDK